MEAFDGIRVIDFTAEARQVPMGRLRSFWMKIVLEGLCHDAILNKHNLGQTKLKKIISVLVQIFTLIILKGGGNKLQSIWFLARENKIKHA